MGLFWLIAGRTSTYTILKKEAARTRIWGGKGHYMGLNLGFVSGINGYTEFYDRGSIFSPERHAKSL